MQDLHLTPLSDDEKAKIRDVLHEYLNTEEGIEIVGRLLEKIKQLKRDWSASKA